MSGVNNNSQTTNSKGGNMKVYVLTDLEGVSGISDFDTQCWPDSEYFYQSQKMLTEEVNAAVSGALEAGASKIVVCDAHYKGHNILVEQLHKKAELIQGKERPHWLPWIEDGYDAFIQLGTHAMAGTPNACLCHSMELNIVKIKLKNMVIGEIGMAAVAAGSLGIPTVMVSGDRAAIEEMQRLVPSTEGVVVKESLGRYISKHKAPKEARELIQTGTKSALDRIADIPPFIMEPPYQLEVTYIEPKAEYLKKKTNLCSKVIDPTTIRYESENILDLFKIFE